MNDNKDRHFGVGLRGEFLIYTTSVAATKYLPKGIAFPVYLGTAHRILSCMSREGSIGIDVFAEQVKSNKFTLKLSTNDDRHTYLELSGGDRLDISACIALRHFHMLADKMLLEIIEGAILEKAQLNTEHLDG